MNSKRTLAIILTVSVLAFTGTSFSATLRVNNNTGVTGTGVYATLSAAYTAASAGDTLLIEGSTTNYGDLTLTKKIIIFGTGYLLTNNAQTQANLITSKLGNLTYNTGSENSAVSGNTINSIIVNADNITIARNYISNSTPATPSISLNGNNVNIIIKQNCIWGLIRNTDNKTPSVVIKNNLLGAVYLTVSVSSAMIINNSFYWSYAYYGFTSYAIDAYHSIINNNIILCQTSTTGALKFDDTQDNTISYNYMNQAVLASYPGSNNLYSQSDPYKSAGGTYSFIDNNFVVNDASAAITAAQGGGQCGMFGGSEPYVLSGMPAIPHIYKLESDPAGTNTDPLNVTISVKAQN